MKKNVFVFSLISLLLFFIIICMLFVFVSEKYFQNEITHSSVVNVIDGDTFEYYNAEFRKVQKIRLLCVDAPERNQEGYEESRIFLQNIILRKEVRMEKGVTERDKYGRFLRYVYVQDEEGNEIFVNKLLLEEGFARLLIIPPEECVEVLD